MEEEKEIEELSVSRDKAWELVKKYNTHPQDLIHYLESEAVMRELAEYLKHSPKKVEYWAMLGLLHDIDWGLTKDNSEGHLTKMPGILAEAGFPSNFIGNIMSHGYGYSGLPHLKDKKRTEKIEFALAASETVTGLIHAYALMRGKRVGDMEVKGLKKKFKDKTFASGVNRDIILECESLGLTLDEFLGIALEGIKKVRDEVGLE